MAIFNQVVAGGGTTPTGTITITSNGTHDVTNYATADVQVSTTAPAHYIEKAVDANGKLINGSSIIDLTGVTDIGQSVLRFAYYGVTFPANTSVDFSSLTTISGQNACQYMFQDSTGITSIDFSSLTTISGQNACQYMFQDSTGITSVDFSSLTTVGVGNNACDGMFYRCSGLTSADFPSLTTVGNYGCSNMFYRCSGLTNVNLSSLTTVGNNGCDNMFADCPITSINLPALTTVGNSGCASMFIRCSGLTSADFPSLTTVGSFGCYNMCLRCTSLTRISFYALDTNSFGSYTNQFSGMLSSVTGCTVHFPMRIQSTIGSWSDVTGGFGGTNTTVLFDIVTSLTGADSNTYTRSQKNSTGTATAWLYNDTLYYTSGVSDNANGVNEPVVGDTIYSDSACTTAVTTIATVA